MISENDIVPAASFVVIAWSSHSPNANASGGTVAQQGCTVSAVVVAVLFDGLVDSADIASLQHHLLANIHQSDGAAIDIHHEIALLSSEPDTIVHISKHNIVGQMQVGLQLQSMHIHSILLLSHME